MEITIKPEMIQTNDRDADGYILYVPSETTFTVTILGRKCSLYAATAGKWNLALPPARGANWAAGLKQFASKDEALDFARKVQASGVVKVAVA